MFDSILFVITGIVFLLAGIYQLNLQNKIDENRSDLPLDQRKRLKRFAKFMGNLLIVVGVASFLSGGIMLLKYYVS